MRGVLAVVGGKSSGGSTWSVSRGWWGVQLNKRALLLMLLLLLLLLQLLLLLLLLLRPSIMTPIRGCRTITCGSSCRCFAFVRWARCMLAFVRWARWPVFFGESHKNATTRLQMGFVHPLLRKVSFARSCKLQENKMFSMLLMDMVPNMIAFSTRTSFPQYFINLGAVVIAYDGDMQACLAEGWLRNKKGGPQRRFRHIKRCVMTSTAIWRRRR
jgi:hypothetical protein